MSGITVNPNDILSGTINITYESYPLMAYFWNIYAKDNTSGQSSGLSIFYNLTGPLNNASAGVVEAYDLQGVTCSDFPNGSNGYTIFGSPSLYVPLNGYLQEYQQVTPTWTLCWAGMSNPPAGCGTTYGGASCGFGASIMSGGGTSLSY